MLRIRDWDKHFETHRTRELRKLEWVPVPNRMDGDGYTDLLDHPDGAAHLGAWLAIIQVASKCATRGTLMRDTGEAHDAKSLARISRITSAVLSEAIPRLVEIGWLEEFDPEAEKNQKVAAPRKPARIPRDPAQTPREVAAIPRDPATRAHAREGKGMEGNGTEENVKPFAPQAEPGGLFSAPTESASLLPFDGVEAKPEASVSRKTVTYSEAERTRWFNEKFWPVVWAKIGVGAARSMWLRKVHTPEMCDRLVAAAIRQKAAIMARAASSTSGSPIHPATWIHAERYDDEQIAGACPPPTPQYIPEWEKPGFQDA